MAEYVQVLTTVGSEEEVAEIADALLERRLAACVPKTEASRYDEVSASLGA